MEPFCTAYRRGPAQLPASAPAVVNFHLLTSGRLRYVWLSRRLYCRRSANTAVQSASDGRGSRGLTLYYIYVCSMADLQDDELYLPRSERGHFEMW